MDNSKRLKLYWILPGGYSDTRKSLSIPAYHRDYVNAVLAKMKAKYRRNLDRAHVRAAELLAEKDAYIAQLQKYCDYLVSTHAAREQRLKEWIDKVDDEIGWNHENDEIGQAVEAALTTVVKQFCTVWSQGITSCPVCGSGGSCKHRKQEKQP